MNSCRTLARTATSLPARRWASNAATAPLEPVETVEQKSGVPSDSILTDGTPMAFLKFYKQSPAPDARPNSEYPSWLWDVLKEDTVKMTRPKAIRRDAIKASNFAKGSA